MTYRDIDINQEKAREYYWNNREDINKQRKEKYQINIEKNRRIAREQYHKNIMKRRKARRLSRLRHLESTRIRQQAQKLKQRKTTRLLLKSIKEATGCKLCGEKDYRCLDYHHKDKHNKIGEVCRIARDKLKLLQSELDKCVLLCANCHRKHHLAGTERFRRWEDAYARTNILQKIQKENQSSSHEIHKESQESY